ncbi:MAG TPA: CsgG/HfaB family protein [Caulobacteraceae bacterium]|nr:CsgG/HfaB family protein [Caulobacteraceae bacterium]
MSKLPVYPAATTSQSMLNDLPPPERPIAVAVYGFNDETGQFKLVTTGQTLSRAISQGGSAMLVHSLQETGNRTWFTVVEREQLKDLLNERQLIRDMRAQYLGEKAVNPQALPALLFAGVLLEGGVVGYDTNTVTGGVGASLLGIGADAKYQQDTVTVYLRAVSVKTGEVLTSITASKTITSYAVDANVFRYVGSTSLLETEGGFTTNEPGLLALQQAIDKATYGLVMEGVDLKLWNFADPAAGWPALWRYNQERDGRLTAEQVANADRRAHAGRRGAPASADEPPPPPPPAAPGPAAANARTPSPPVLAATQAPPPSPPAAPIAAATVAPAAGQPTPAATGQDRIGGLITTNTDSPAALLAGSQTASVASSLTH